MIEATLESAGRSAVRAAPRRAPVPSQAACACICVSVSSVATNRGINRCCAGSGMVNGSLAQITDASPTRTFLSALDTQTASGRRDYAMARLLVDLGLGLRGEVAAFATRRR